MRNLSWLDKVKNLWLKWPQISGFANTKTHKADMLGETLQK
jgi:hypothetical protein|tara:strand:+ start:603 stop:725 length:123 start_codon:yes stop_codon:yes gene_type:complete